MVCFFNSGAKNLQKSSRIQKISIKFAVVMGMGIAGDYIVDGLGEAEALLVIGKGDGGAVLGHGGELAAALPGIGPGAVGDEVADGTVAGVAVGTKNHVTAFSHGFTRILMDDSQIGGNVDTTILLGSRETEDVVVLVDSSTYSTKRVVAVGHCVGKWEFLQAAGAGCLNDTHVGDVVRHHGIKTDMHFVVCGVSCLMSAQYLISDGLFACFVG